jgi:hypothetical protein
MKAIERVYQYLKHKQIRPIRFEKANGFSNGYLGTQLKRKGNLGEDVVNRIVRNFPDISLEWLMLGNGDMLRSSKNSKMVNEPSEEYGTDYKDLAEQRGHIIEELKKEIKNLEKTISNLKK